MLSSDPKRLRFLGIEMLSRTRRRWAVVLTYGVYFSVMLKAPEHLFPQARAVMFAASVCVVLFGLFGLSGPVKFFEGGRETETLDERELSERNRASYLTLRFLTTMLVISALNFRHEFVKRQPDDLIAMMLEYAVLAMTSPKAIILWTTADPEKSGEIGLVDEGNLKA